MVDRRKEDIAEEIDKLIEEGTIEPSESPFNNAFLPVAKTCPVTGKLKIRICLDCRSINRHVVADIIPVNDVQTLINRLDGVQFMSVIDCASGYLQIPLERESQKYTSFKFRSRSYTYKKLPFGLASAPACYTRLMNIVLSGVPNVFCYMDDIILYSKTLDKHLARLDLIFKRFSFHGLELNIKKCQFLKTEVEYLGFRNLDVDHGPR